jgi:hypothetical protein
MISTREARELELEERDMIEAAAEEMDRLEAKDGAEARLERETCLAREARCLSNPITVAFLIFVFGLVFFGTLVWLAVR